MIPMKDEGFNFVALRRLGERLTEGEERKEKRVLCREKEVSRGEGTQAFHYQQSMPSEKGYI